MANHTMENVKLLLDENVRLKESNSILESLVVKLFKVAFQANKAGLVLTDLERLYLEAMTEDVLVVHKPKSCQEMDHPGYDQPHDMCDYDPDKPCVPDIGICDCPKAD